MEHNPPTTADYAWAGAQDADREINTLRARILVLEQNLDQLGEKVNEVIEHLNAIVDHLKESDDALSD